MQLRFAPQSRAANAQRLIAAIERASEADPAPDLIVLPGACDTGGVRLGSDWNEATLQGIAETLAWKAREWGVFIAAGLHRR